MAEERAERRAELVTTWGFEGGGIVQMRVELVVTMRTEDADGATLARAAEGATAKLLEVVARFVEDGGLAR
jgi:hypothetical protein